jgi:hypothetical protein
MRRKPLFPPPQDPTTKQKKRNKGPQQFTVLTVNGRVCLRRRRWHSPVEGTTAPLDAWIDVAEASISLGVREMACRLNGDGKNFDKSATNLARAAQVSLSGETLRQLVEDEGRRVLRLQKAEKLPVDWSASDCKADGGKTRVYFGCDGVKVPIVTETEKQARRQKIKEKRRRCGQRRRPLPPARKGADQRYKEFKIVTYYDETQDHRLVCGTRGDHQVAGRLMRQQASRIELDQADEKVGLADGAPWIRNQVSRQNLPLDALGLDFYHLSEHVHEARREVYGAEDETGKEWAGDLLHTYKHEGFDKAWEKLVEWRTQQRGGGRKRAADRLMAYVAERRETIAYPEFLKHGWQIGSGPTEATCKTLTARLKGSGMRWDSDNAEALMALEALSQSDQWKSYWQTQIPPKG